MKVIRSAKQLKPGDLLWHVDYEWRKYRVIRRCTSEAPLHDLPCAFIEKIDDGSTGHFGRYFYEGGSWVGGTLCMFAKEENE